eukprot:357074-Chlamydomonas_euryale.AAC.3
MPASKILPVPGLRFIAAGLTAHPASNSNGASANGDVSLGLPQSQKAQIPNTAQTPNAAQIPNAAPRGPACKAFARAPPFKPTLSPRGALHSRHRVPKP